MNLKGRWRYVRLARLVWKLPTYARLVWGIMRDPRTPIGLKAILAAAVAYVVSPLDLVPDMIPILGQADDLTVVLLVLDLFIQNAPEDVRRDHMRRATDGTADLDRDLARHAPAARRPIRHDSRPAARPAGAIRPAPRSGRAQALPRAAGAAVAWRATRTSPDPTINP